MSITQETLTLHSVAYNCGGLARFSYTLTFGSHKVTLVGRNAGHHGIRIFFQETERSTYSNLSTPSLTMREVEERVINPIAFQNVEAHLKLILDIPSNHYNPDTESVNNIKQFNAVYMRKITDLKKTIEEQNKLPKHPKVTEFGTLFSLGGAAAPEQDDASTLTLGKTK